MKLKYSIILPVHNERTNAKKLIDEILEIYPNNDYEIIAVNDNSTDDTLEILEKINNSKLKIISHKKNKGQSAAMITGAENCNSDICVFLDGDGQNDPQYVNNMVKLLEKSASNIKLVIGERQDRQHTVSKKVQSAFGNWIRNLLLGDGCRDSGCGLKVIYKKEFLKLHRLNNLHRFIPYLLKIHGYTFLHYQIKDRPREYGESHYNIFKRLTSVLETYICFLLWFVTSNLRID